MEPKTVDCPAETVFKIDDSKNDMIKAEFREKLKEILFKEPFFEEYLKELKSSLKGVKPISTGPERTKWTTFLKANKTYLNTDLLRVRLQEIRENQSYKIVNFLRDSYNTGNELYSDLEIHVEDRVYMAHRVVIACYIPFIFYRLARLDRTTETRKIRLSGITCQGFAPILRFVYTGIIEPTEKDFVSVLETAFKFCMYDFAELWFDIYEEKLGTITARNLLRYRLAKLYGWTEYESQLTLVLALDFENLLLSDLFDTLTMREFSGLLEQDEVGVQKEIVLFIAVLKWLNNDWKIRKQYAVSLMELIRFSLMDEDELLACFQPPVLPEVMEIREIKGMIAGAFNELVLTKRPGFVNSKLESCKPRQYMQKGRSPLELWSVGERPRPRE